MKNMMLIALVAAAISGAARAGYETSSDAISPGRWHGSMLRDGLRVPLAVELAQVDGRWMGIYSFGSSEVPLSGVQISRTRVHFELPGEGVFEGTIASGEMAGTVSGSGAAGSFALTREGPDPITESGP